MLNTQKNTLKSLGSAIHLLSSASRHQSFAYLFRNTVCVQLQYRKGAAESSRRYT